MSLQGETDIEQLAIVLRHLGSPTSESWPELTTLPDYNKITFPYHKATSWENIVQDAQPEAIDLIRQILIYNSSRRLTPKQVKHNCFFFRTYCLNVIKKIVAGVVSQILLLQTVSVNEESDQTTAGPSFSRKTERNQSERATKHTV